MTVILLKDISLLLSFIADTRVIYHALLKGTTNVVIVANGSDIPFLDMYACAVDKSRRWFCNYEDRTYADLVKFTAFYGDIALYFPMFNFRTGCETMSYYHYRGITIP